MMNSTRLPRVAAAAVCVLVLTFAGPAAAQYPYSPMTPPAAAQYPYSPMTPPSAPSVPPNAPEDRTLTTNPDRSKPAPQLSYLPCMWRRIWAAVESYGSLWNRAVVAFREDVRTFRHTEPLIVVSDTSPVLNLARIGVGHAHLPRSSFRGGYTSVDRALPSVYAGGV